MKRTYCVVIGLILFSYTMAQAAIKFWDGGGADANWRTAANWDANAMPLVGDSLVFTGAVRTAAVNNFGIATNFTGITFGSNASAFTLSGNQVRLTGGITNETALLQIINLSITNTAAININAGTGGLTLGANMQGSAVTLNAGTLKAGATISLPNVTFQGSSIFDLNGNNVTIPNIPASTANNLITNSAAGAGTNTLTLSALANTYAGQIHDGPNRATALSVVNGNISIPAIGLGVQSTFSGGLFLSPGNNTRLAINGVVTTTLDGLGNIISGPFGRGPIVMGANPGDKGGVYVSTGGVTVRNDVVFNTAAGSDRVGFRVDATGCLLSGKITANKVAATFCNANAAAGDVTLSGVVTGPFGLTSYSDGGGANYKKVTVILANTSGTPNNYQGDTSLNNTESFLALAASDQVPNGANAGNLVISGGTFQMKGWSDTVNGLSGSGTVENGGSIGSSSLLKIGDNNATGQLFSGLFQNTSGTLAVEKIGAGLQLLSGISTHSGATTLSEGRLGLVVGGACANSDVVVTNGVLDLKINDISKQWFCKSLTFNVGTTALYFDYNYSGTFLTPSPTTAPLVVNGNMDFTATPTVYVDAGLSLPAGTYPLVTWTGSLLGTAPTAVVLPSQVQGSLSLSGGNTLLLTVTAASAQPLTWTTGTGDWLIGGALLNWKDANNAATTYQEPILPGDRVVFDDSADGSGPNVVSLNTTVTPTQVTVNNASEPYTLSGSGQITGPTSLTKAGAGVLTLETTNNFTGGTTLNGGQVNLNASGAAGAAASSLTIASPIALDNTSASPVTLNNHAQFWNADFTFIGSQGLNLGAGAVTLGGSREVTVNADTLTVGGVISGSGLQMTKKGAGTLALNAANTFNGGTSVAEGTVNVGVANGLGTGPVTMGEGSTLNLLATTAGDITYGGLSTSLSGTGTVNVALLTGTSTRTLNGDYSSFVGTFNLGVNAVDAAGKVQMNGLYHPETVINVLSNATLYFNSVANSPRNQAINLYGGNTGEVYGQLRLDGAVTWSGPITLAGDMAATRPFVGANSGSPTFSGPIGETGGPRMLSVMANANSITISGTNTYTGPTWFWKGTLRVPTLGSINGGASALGSPTSAAEATVRLGSGTDGTRLLYTGTGETSDRPIELTGGAHNAHLQHAGTGYLRLTGNVTPTVSGNKTLFLEGSTTGTGIVAGVISEYPGSLTSITKDTLGGVWMLSGDNTFRGNITINAGIIVAAHSGALGISNKVVTMTAGSDGHCQLHLDGSVAPVILGTNIWYNASNNADEGAFVNLAGTNTIRGEIQNTTGGGGVAFLSKAGKLIYDGNYRATTAGRAVFLRGDGDGEVSGIIRNGSTVGLPLNRDMGTGTWILSNTNTFTGVTTISSGTLALDGAMGSILGALNVNAGGTFEVRNTVDTDNTNRLGDAAAVTMNGGTFSFTHTAGATNYSETVGTLTASAGANVVKASQADEGQTSILTFASLAKTGGSIDFQGIGLGVDDRNKILFTNAPSVSPIGLWATCNNGAYFAAYSAERGVYATNDTAFAALKAEGLSVVPDDATLSATINEQGEGGGVTLAGSATNKLNGLLQNSGFNSTITMTDKIFQVSDLMIAAGKANLTLGGAAGEGAIMPLTDGGVLSLINMDATSVLTLNAPVTNSTLASRISKSGQGLVRLNGVNTYTGTTLVNDGTLAYGSDANQTISGGISGGGSLEKGGAGTLTLSGANTFSGTLRVSGGTLKAGNAAALGAATGTTIVESGATLDVNNQNLGAEVVQVQGAGVDGAGALVNMTGSQINALRFVTLTGDTTFGGAARWDIRANTTATFDMGGFTLTKTNVNYNPMVSVGIVNPGHVVINQGTFNFSDNTTAGGSAANTVTVKAGAKMGLYNTATQVDWSLLLDGGATLDAENGTGTTRNKWAGPVTMGGDSTFNCTGDLNVSGKISGSAKLTKTGAGTLTLTADNDYASGTLISSNSVQLGNGVVDGNVLGAIELANTTAKVIFNNTDRTYSGEITGSGGVDAVQKTGAGIQYLTGNSSYTGVTQFKGGILNVASIGNYGVNSSLGARPLAMEQNAGSLIGLNFQRGTLQFTGTSPQSTDRQIRILGNNKVAGVSITNTIDASGVGVGTLSFTYSGPNTNFWDTQGTRILKLTGSNVGDNLFAINISSHSSGQTSLIKSGPGKWIVSNPKNGAPLSDVAGTYCGYAGGTLVEGGWLSFVTNGLGSAGTIEMTGSSTLEWYGVNSQDISARFKINDGVTATLNTGTNDVTLGSVLLLATAKTASITKMGSGTLTLSGTNQYLGVTTVAEGTLRLGVTNALKPSVSVVVNGAVLDVNNQIQALSALSGTGTLGLSSGRLDLAGALDLSTFSLRIDSNGLDKETVYTILNVGGTLSGTFNAYSSGPIPGWIPQYNYDTGSVSIRYAPPTIILIR